MASPTSPSSRWAGRAGRSSEATARWVPVLRGLGVEVRDLTPANSGVVTDWSEHFGSRFAGAPLKRIAVTCGGRTVRGEAIVTRRGLEGGVDLWLEPRNCARPRRSRSTSSPTERGAGRREARTPARQGFDQQLAAQEPQSAAGGDRPVARAGPDAIRRSDQGPRRAHSRASEGLERAISSAGGIARSELDENLPVAATARRLCGRRNARLGRTDRRLSAAGLLLDRPLGGPARPTAR